jgi:hypothetical protein
MTAISTFFIKQATRQAKEYFWLSEMAMAPFKPLSLSLTAPRSPQGLLQASSSTALLGDQVFLHPTSAATGTSSWFLS